MPTGLKRSAFTLLVATFAAAFVAAPVIAEPAGKPAASETAAPAAAATAKPEFSEEAFLDAAYNNCATVENRSAKSCGCERKLIGDRVNADDKRMAFLYWTDQETFRSEFEKRRSEDPEWQKGFGDRFSSLQALIFAACGA